MNNVLKGCFLTAMAVSLGLLCPAESPAAGKILIRISHTGAADNEFSLGYEKFKELVEARTNGQVQVKIFPNAVMTFFPGYAHLRFGTPSSGLGMCYGLSALGMLAGSLFVARNRRFPPFTVIRAAALLSAGGIALMPFLPSFWALLVPLWLCSLQDGAIRPCLSAVMAGLGGREQRSAVMSLDVTVFRLSQSLSPLLFGGALELAGYDGMFLGGAAALLLLVLLVLPAQGGRP